MEEIQDKMSEIRGIFGLQGWGKTALTTYLLKLAYQKGYKIFCNYHLSFPYTPVTTIKEAQQCRNGYLGLDEIWKWVHARTSQSNINKEMMSICLLNRKRGVSIIYNSQLRRTVDVILRDVTNKSMLPQMKTHEDGKRYIHYIEKDLIGRYSKETTIPLSIDIIGKWFNTREEIGTLDATPLQEGIIDEGDFIKAVKKHPDYLDHIHLKNSGYGSKWGCDIIVWFKNRITLAIDVKGAKGRVWYRTSKGEQNKRIKSIEAHGGIPYLAFPKSNRTRLTTTNAWYMYKLHNQCYILGRKDPSYNKMVAHSTLLSKFKLNNSKNSNLIT